MIDNLIRAATCRVTCGNNSGSGHLITACNVLTARHCVIAAIESGNAIELIFPGRYGDISLPATIVAQSEELDACILSVSKPLDCQPIPINATIPREGDGWRSFGYPISKTFIGHRISGTISHFLDTPKLKMDIDLTVDLGATLQSYEGLSGAAVVSGNACRGMIKLKVDGTIGAISVFRLEKFFSDNGIQISKNGFDDSDSDKPRGGFADRSEFQGTFEQMIVQCPGGYIFLEGAHGIGKTTFCIEFKPANQHLFSLGTYCIGLKGRGPGANFRAQPEVFFDWLSTAVSTLITGKNSRKKELSYSSLISETSNLLDAFSRYCASTHRHGVLFIDGLNEAAAADNNALTKLIGLLPTSLPQGITIVLTAPNYHNMGTSLSGLVKSNHLISLPLLSDEATSAYCWQELVRDRATPVLVENICKKALGHPLYLRYLIEHVNCNPADGSLYDFPTLTGPIEEYYESLWPRLLKDEKAIDLLAIMARLRWGIRTTDLLKVLSSEEQIVFIPTITRIRHLLLSPDTTTIYHPSFTEFLISKTALLETVVHTRIAEFCKTEFRIDYCILNLVFHLLRVDEAKRYIAIDACNQKWVDKCVELGVEPDNLLSDIKATLSEAVKLAAPVEVVRILLLYQRVSFRYNTLFTQSACLISEALISLGRPGEALKHAIRFDTLILRPDESLHIAFLLIQHKYIDKALELLNILYKRILEEYSLLTEKINIEAYLNLSCLHLQTLLFVRLAKNGGMMQEIINFEAHIIHELKVSLSEWPPEILEYAIISVKRLPTSYFLCFHDAYATLDKLKEKAEVPQDFLQHIIAALLECEDSIEKYNLPNHITSLSQVFADIEKLLVAGKRLDNLPIPEVSDMLIKMGAPSSLVSLIMGHYNKLAPKHLKIKAMNGVDIDYSNICENIREWRIKSFLDSNFDCPLVGAFNDTGWLSSLDQLIRALSWCEGMARRAKADGNETLQLRALEFLKVRVLDCLTFTLAQRVRWKDSYAIPESVFPLIYEGVSLLLRDCYPEELPEFLSNISYRTVDQCGLYSEGFREVIFTVIRKLTMREIEPFLFDEVFRLLQHLKEHIIRGVENRHELVPELLKLIPLFAKVGAKEEAERLYQYMLSVSMGPSWYKEDQLGLMTSVLHTMPSSDNVQTMLPLIAGYLERASGEMTFQRFVRYEKHAFIGELFRLGRFVSGCKYFKRQSCGTTDELISESQHGFSDKPKPNVGMRYPGGAIDEQAAILEIVRNANELNWRLRWALLEIFQCGDERYLSDYATEYAKIINQANSNVAIISEMVSRFEFVAGTEIDPEKKSQLLKTFSETLYSVHHNAFSDYIPEISNTDSLYSVCMQTTNTSALASIPADANFRNIDDLYLPGLFGRQPAEKEADVELEAAETHLKLQNFNAAKMQATKSLKILQEGDWSIWGNLSRKSTRAEEIFREGATTAADVIRCYAPLIESERHEAKWRIAEHVAAKVADLLGDNERIQLLQNVIDHVRLMVGDANNDIVMFDFLIKEPPCDGSKEMFRFVLWLLDHPQSLRREKAAGMATWLVENEPVYFEEAVKEAFSMVTGYSADIMCRVLDEMSMTQPQSLWERVFVLLDLEEVLRDCKHVNRLAVLHRIAERAGNAGSSTGAEVASRVLHQFRSGTIDIRTSERKRSMPHWASCISPEWDKLDQLDLISKELIIGLEEELTKICAPLDVISGWSLERAVSYSFREESNKQLNRWEAKVRFALNSTLFPYVSRRNFRRVESILRISNPLLPDSDFSKPD